MPTRKTAVVIPNLNGREIIPASLDSLQSQMDDRDIIVVDNGSSDGSAEFISNKYPDVQLIRLEKNRGFAGGVNAGIKQALEQGYGYIALFNNDAVAAKGWLKNLEGALDKNKRAGIATSKILDKTEKQLDSTGDIYTTWGLPFPRGRGEIDSSQYDSSTTIFAASGGASVYRAAMFKQIGLFDEDFFAYYEDVDISFRAQLLGWQVIFVPSAIAYHAIGETSAKIPGFTTYQTLKNLPMLLWKNVPLVLLPKIFIRFLPAYFSIYLSAVARGQFAPATKGLVMSIILWPKKLWQRTHIQSARKVPASYISSLLVHDLPPNARKLRILRRCLSLGTIR